MTAREAALADALRDRAQAAHGLHLAAAGAFEACRVPSCVDARALLAEPEGAPLTAERLRAVIRNRLPRVAWAAVRKTAWMADVHDERGIAYADVVRMEIERWLDEPGGLDAALAALDAGGAPAPERPRVFCECGCDPGDDPCGEAPTWEHPHPGCPVCALHADAVRVALGEVAP